MTTTNQRVISRWYRLRSDIAKRPRSDIAEHNIWSGSALFASNTGPSRHRLVQLARIEGLNGLIPCFRWTCSGDADELPPDHMNLKHVKLSVLQCVVEFIYTGNLNVTASSLNDVLKFCSELDLQQAVKVCQSDLHMKLEVKEKQTAAESNTKENCLTFEEPESSPQFISDNYEDSTDTDNVVESEIKEKQKTNKISRKRSHSVLGDQKENEKKLKKNSKKDNRLVKVLKVPKLAISFKERKTKDDVGETKPRRRKQLQPEKKSKVKKNTKLTGIWFVHVDVALFTLGVVK